MRDVKVLQREQKEDVPGVLKLIAYLTVGAIAAALIALIAWALLRLEGGEPRRRRPRAPSRSPAGTPNWCRSAPTQWLRNVSETSGSLAGTPSPR